MASRKSTAKRSGSKSVTRKKKTTARRGTATPKSRATKSRAAKSRASKARPAGRTKMAARGRGDFGVPVGKRTQALAASKETRNRSGGDRNREQRQPRSGVDSREAGVGGREAGPGSSSGGDLDPDFVGLDGSGLAQSGPDTNIGAAGTTAGSEQFASGGPARGDKPSRSPSRRRGSTVHRAGDSTTTDTTARDGDVRDGVGFSQPDDFGAGPASIEQASSGDSAQGLER